MPRVVSSLFMGIDPGASGGMVVLGFRPASATPIPDTEKDTWEWVKQFKGEATAVIEKVQGYIGPGSAFPGSAMFRFGQFYGFLRACLIAAEIPFEEVTPQKWQKALGIVPKKRDEKKGDFKNRLKARAQQMFPTEKVTLNTADAFLIAEYCRRTHAKGD